MLLSHTRINLDRRVPDKYMFKEWREEQNMLPAAFTAEYVHITQVQRVLL